MRKAVVELATGKVANVIEIKDGSTWLIPVGHILIEATLAGSPGDTWDGVKFVSPPIPAPPPDPDVELAKAIETATTLAELKFALIGKVAKVKARTV